jgi:hypothetical protein
MMRFKTLQGFYLPGFPARIASIEITTLRPRHGRIGASVETRI